MGYLTLPEDLRRVPGRNAEVVAFKGRVVECKVWSESHVSSSGGGGGGYITGQGGGFIHVNPTTISTAVTENREFILKDGEREKDFRLTNVSLALRPGHVVTVIWVNKKSGSGHYVMAVNHTLQRTAFVGTLRFLVRIWYKILKPIAYLAIVPIGILSLLAQVGWASGEVAGHHAATMGVFGFIAIFSVAVAEKWYLKSLSARFTNHFKRVETFAGAVEIAG